MAKNRLTVKQNRFKDLVVSGVEPPDAYREVYNCTGSSKNAIATNASQLMSHPLVSKEIEEARKQIRQKSQLTAEDLIVELEEARELAKKLQEPSPMVKATMGKAKLLGLDKVIVEVTDAEELTPWSSISAGIDAS